ncbi:MAG: CopD family protein [Anaerolineae bacterium]|nr:CopD family protein [Anaerolineae bacterium]
MNSRQYRFFALSILAFLLFTAVGSAAAHGYLLRAIPEDRSTLERAPARVQYWFSEPLEPDFSTVMVRNASGETVAQGGVNENASNLLEARLPSSLPDGAYMSELRIAFASDGHVIVETRSFFVGEGGAEIEGARSGDQVIVLEVIWRFILYASLLLLTGTFGLYALVLLPAWGNRRYPAGELPPRVISALNQIIVAGFIGAFAGSALALLQQTMAFFGAEPGQVITEGLFNVVRTGTRFGDMWNIRMIILLAAAGMFAASLYFRERQPAFVRAFLSANTFALTLALGTLSLSGHAAGSLVQPWLALAADWLHLAAVGLWVGGLAALVMLLPAALRPYEGDARRTALLAVLNRFSPVALVCFLIVTATGIFSATVWVTAPGQLGSRYVLTLLVKVLLVGVILAMAAAHYIALRPERFERWSARVAKRGGWLTRLRLEVMIAVFVVCAAAWLSATPVPPQAVTTGDAPPVGGIQQIGDDEISLLLAPGGPGVNTYDVVVQRDGVPVDDLSTWVRLVDPALDRRSAWLPADGLEDGLYSNAGAEITRAGEWLALVEIEYDGETLRVVFPVTIREEAAVAQSQSPTALNLLAMLILLGVVGFALYPLIRRGVRKLDFSPVIVVTAILAVFGGGVVVAVGIAASESATAQFSLLTDPPPQVLNTMLPDQASLERGRALLESCHWEETTGWIELTRRLPRLRDEGVYFATLGEWDGLPACDSQLSDGERWDIVNYVRSRESRGG